jgi:site-specific recombinase XerD
MTTTKTIAQIISEWLDSADIAEVSKRSYRTKLNLWFRWLNNIHYEVRRPTQQQVLDYKRHLESKGKSSLTVDSYITAVRLFYRYCVKMRYCGEDITQGVRSSTKLRGYRKSPLSREDAMRLLDSISTERLTGKRDKLMIAMMLLLGFRTCEIERMDVGDIGEVYDTRVVNVQRKGRHDKAESVALTPYINELLQDYMSEREVEEWSEPLFISVKGERTRLQRTTISEIVHDRLRAIGINDPHITAHSLRHTCACLLLADGVEMETVRDVLGHTSTNTTRLYVAQMQSQLLIRNSPAKRLESVLRLSHHP